MALSAQLDNANQTRRSLLNRLKDWQDHESWLQFFNTYWRLVYSVAIKAGLTETEAEDVVQDTFVRVAKKMPEFDYDPTKGFRRWLIHTTQFLVRDQFRKRKDHLRHRSFTRTAGRTGTIERVPDPASLNIEKLCEEEWANDLFLLAVEKVKPQVSARHFQIFELYAVKGWPVKKVSETLGVSSGVIYIAKHRVGQLVKKELKRLKDKRS